MYNNPCRTLAMWALTFCCWLTMDSALASTHNKAGTLVFAAPKATHLSTLGNINLGVVNNIMQSANGYIWLATNEGLVRYDGYSAKRYVHKGDDSNSLSHNMVMDVAQDNSGNLWISTLGGGLNKLTLQTGQFEKIDLHLNPKDSSPTDQLYFLTLDQQNQLWIGSAAGLMRVDVDSQKRLPLPAEFAELPQSLLDGAFIDSHNDLWILTYDHGVFWYHQSKLHQFNYDAKNPNSLSHYRVRSITNDRHGNIWIGTENGLNLFDRKKRTFTRFKPSDNSGFAVLDDDISAISEDIRGTLWLGTTSRGVLTFSPQSRQFTPVTGQPDLYNQFKNGMIHGIFQDRQGTMWFATHNGVVMLARNALNFSYISNTTATLKTTGLTRLGPEKIALIGNFMYYDYDLSRHDWSNRFTDINQTYAVKADNNDQIWLSTLADGNYQFNGSDRSPIKRLKSQNKSSIVPIESGFVIHHDQTNRSWIAPFTKSPQIQGGLYRYDSLTQSYETFLAQPVLSDMIDHNEHTLLVATIMNGLVEVDIKAKAARYWNETISSTPKRPVTLLKDSQNVIWVGTRGKGLARFDAEKQQFTYYDTDDGLLSNNIVSMVQDNNDDLWLGSPIGLSRFTPKTGQVLNFEQQDGLLFSNFYQRGAIKMTDGQIIMATNSGLVIFRPDSIKAQPVPSNVVINQFKLSNQPVALRHTDKRSPLIKPIAYTDKLTLSYQHYLFSFGFTAMDYVRQDKRLFAYQMEGLDSQWIYTDANNRVATYTTLSPGNYTFKVTTTRPDGSWSDQYRAIEIVVTPPWWQTNTAYMIYAVGVYALFNLFTFIRTRRLRRRAAELEKGIEQRTVLLQQRADTITELLTDKERLFSNVSHELRTPLTLILNPIQMWLESAPDEPATRKLTMMKRNGLRLLRLVEQMLTLSELSMTDTQQQTYRLSTILNPMIRAFQPLLDKKQIKLVITPHKEMSFKLKTDTLELILTNLLSNAIKYTPQHGEITLTITHIEQMATITVSDNGIGIEEADHARIFERFVRITDPSDQSISGTGIGLALVKELVQSNDGNIRVGSQIGRGSTFIVELPVIEVSDNNNTVEQSLPGNLTQLETDLMAAVSGPHTNQLPQTVDNPSPSLPTILLIDDNPDMLILLNDTLSPHFTCHSANNGNDGLKLALAQIPDIIICDVMMPGISGFEVARHLKTLELCCHIPLILLTAKGDIDSKMTGWQQDIDEYMVKPFAPQELIARVRNLLSIRQLLKRRFAQTAFGSHVETTDFKAELTDKDQQFIEKLDAAMGEHYADAQLTCGQLANLLLIGERQLNRKLNALFDQSFIEYLRKYRLRQSAALMKSGLQISQICDQCGFTTSSYFAKYFKAEFGVTPKQYQKTVFNPEKSKKNSTKP